MQPAAVTTDENDPILSALSHREDEAKLLATWRAIASGDDAQRRDLRALCPAERRDDDYELKLVPPPACPAESCTRGFSGYPTGPPPPYRP